MPHKNVENMGVLLAFTGAFGDNCSLASTWESAGFATNGLLGEEHEMRVKAHRTQLLWGCGNATL
jgi:hypothetical protein